MNCHSNIPYPYDCRTDLSMTRLKLSLRRFYLICGIFNEAVGISHHRESKGRKINELLNSKER